MSTTRISVRNIEALSARAAASKKVLFLWDTKVRGFGVKASAKGNASYIVQKWIGGRGGKALRLNIGEYPAKNLDTARKDAGATINEVHKGINVVQAKRDQRSAIKHDISTQLEPTIRLYLAKKAEPNSRYWSETQRLLLSHVVPLIGRTTPVASVTKAAIRDLIETKEEIHPGAARNLFAALRPLFKWCVERDLISSTPMQSLTAPKLCEARDRRLSETEIRLFWRAAGSMGYPFGPFYQLLLLTAQRRDEVAGMRKSELDLIKGEWLIPKERTKNSKAHLVHLSPQALSIISSLRINPSDFVFTTTNETAISGFSRAKQYLDCAMRTEGRPAEFSSETFQPWRVHDLRRTAASGMAELGFQPHIVERVLNHISGAQGGLVGVYQRFEYAEERKRAIHAWANHVTASQSQLPTTNVVSIR